MSFEGGLDTFLDFQIRSKIYQMSVDCSLKLQEAHNDRITNNFIMTVQERTSIYDELLTKNLC